SDLLPKRRILGWTSRPTFSMPMSRLRWSFIGTATKHMGARDYDVPCCGRVNGCGGEAKLGALERGIAQGRPGDPLWFFSRLRCSCAWGGAGTPVLQLS